MSTILSPSLKLAQKILGLLPHTSCRLVYYSIFFGNGSLINELKVLELTHAIAKDHLGITIDTVERFQGSERRVMIVSPVRSTSPKELGFVDCPKVYDIYML
jgi:hypothetical protein